MSSFTRMIQRTVKRASEDSTCRAPHYMRRGSQLGVVNPRDPCRTKIKAKPKPWRSKAATPPAKAKTNMGAPVRIVIDRTAGHKAKMAKKAARRQAVYESNGNIKFHDGFGRNRHTGKPHEDCREKARRVRQTERSNV